MAKFYGKIGYSKTVEVSSGVWDEDVTEKNHSGDFIRNSRGWQNGESVNDDLTINNQISIIADSSVYQDLYSMKYVKLMGAAWKIIKIDIQSPRVILTIGGIYNGKQAPASGTP